VKELMLFEKKTKRLQGSIRKVKEEKEKIEEVL